MLLDRVPPYCTIRAWARATPWLIAWRVAGETEPQSRFADGTMPSWCSSDTISASAGAGGLAGRRSANFWKNWSDVRAATCCGGVGWPVPAAPAAVVDSGAVALAGATGPVVPPRLHRVSRDLARGLCTPP